MLTRPLNERWPYWREKDKLRLLARLRQKRQELRGEAEREPPPWETAGSLLELAERLWPEVTFYDKQREIFESVEHNDETVIISGHKLGKDFSAGAIALTFFLMHHPVRIVTTSIRDEHLAVLWGEVGRFIDNSAVPLNHRQGGPLVVNHRHIRKMVDDTLCKISYLIGMVSAKGEGMQGHHAAHTLLIVDEASGVDDEVFLRSETWAKKRMIFGNPYGANSYFHKIVKGGDVLVP